ncbi:hypothetical protein Ait01nite_059240 [Actinoplanes italicus]|uniref:Uncharacterized protein n=1 Tax=Actinoplanes italicus TaxID=113567 RepID=A0A2T0K6A4_9ACTN|nr:hypothetical protein [Actinoplanes italicus]PRX18540.1 hypothetical protein CLV67_11214 [Actinoplanes italicus]GIE32879.1 hypothetical protein Ait01nite_059240 [Actinoplanes italicus]
MSVQAEGRFWSGIDIPKTIAGTLAAVSAAVLGSFLGVAGTMIGAALASVISSIGTEIYHRSIDRSAKRLQSAFTVAPAAVGTPAVEATDAAPSEETTVTEPRRIHWKRVALVAGAFFVLGLGVLTTAELFAGRSAADVTSGRDNGGPTILFDQAGDDHDEKEPAVVTSKPPAVPATDTTAPSEPTPGATTPAEPAPTSEGPTATTSPETGTPEDTETDTGTESDIGAAPEEGAETGE